MNKKRKQPLKLCHAAWQMVLFYIRCGSVSTSWVSGTVLSLLTVLKQIIIVCNVVELVSLGADKSVAPPCWQLRDNHLTCRFPMWSSQHMKKRTNRMCFKIWAKPNSISPKNVIFRLAFFFTLRQKVQQWSASYWSLELTWSPFHTVNIHIAGLMYQ